VGDIEEKCLAHPLAPLLEAFGVAGGTKSSGPTGKTKKKFSLAGRTTNAGKSTFGVAAVKIALHHLFDNRPEESVFPLKAAFILGQELVKIMEEHPIEDGALGMTGAVDSWHSRQEYPENRPEERVGSFPPENGWPQNSSIDQESSTEVG